MRILAGTTISLPAAWLYAHNKHHECIMEAITRTATAAAAAVADYQHIHYSQVQSMIL